MKFSELKNRAVVDVDQAKTIGHLDSLLIDPATRAVKGLKVKSGLFDSGHVLPLSQVRSVGQDAITVSQALVGSATDATEPTSSEDERLKNLPGVDSVIGSQVVTSSGKLVGQISDLLLDDQLTITGYEVSQGGLFAKKHSIEATPDLNFGNKMVIISEQVANQIAS
jgi:uncharacterized protein YrrD